jgi:hypothetical protein
MVLVGNPKAECIPVYVPMGLNGAQKNSYSKIVIGFKYYGLLGYDPCTLAERYQSFGKKFCSNLQGVKAKREKSNHWKVKLRIRNNHSKKKNCLQFQAGKRQPSCKFKLSIWRKWSR